MKLEIFSDKSYRRYVHRQLRPCYMCRVGIDHVPDGIIVNEHQHGFGIFDKNFHFMRSSRQVRRNNGQFVPKFNHENIPYVNRDVVFIGNVYPQFGHFLLEHMNRAWALRDEKYRDMYVALINNQGINPVPEYMYRFIELMGVPRERIMIVDGTTQFRNVYIPHQAFNIPICSSDEFGKTFDTIADNVKDYGKNYERVYMSRDALKSRRTYGEKYVSDIFAKNGFHIVCPETLSLDEQIAIAKNCRVMAGCAGTALHLALFMKPGGTVIQIKRNRIHDDNVASQFLIDETKKLNSVFITGSIEKYKTLHGVVLPQIIGLNKYMREFFDANNFVYNKDAPIIDSDTWNEYLHAADASGLSGRAMLMFRFKGLVIRLSACLIPGRERRGVWRAWLKKKLNVE